jgi:galactose mutarotase-like enzyme
MPKFVCIEPWYSLPSAEGASIKWEEKPAAAVLNPGEAWSCTLSTSFVR